MCDVQISSAAPKWPAPPRGTKRCLQLHTLWWHHRGCLLALEHDLATSVLIPNTIVLLILHIPVVCMRQEGDMSTRTALLCLDMSAPSGLQSQRTPDYDLPDHHGDAARHYKVVWMCLICCAAPLALVTGLAAVIGSRPDTTSEHPIACCLGAYDTTSIFQRP